MAAGGRRDVPRRRQRRTDPRAREGGSKHEARGGAAGSWPRAGLAASSGGREVRQSDHLQGGEGGFGYRGG